MASLINFICIIFCTINVKLAYILNENNALTKPITDKSLLPPRSFVMPTIFWDPRNPIFYCPNKDMNTLNLRLNDYIQFACPKEGRTIDWHESLGHSYLHMFENAFYTENQTAVEHCTAGDSWPFFLRCNDPLNGNIFRTIRVSKYSANDADPKFVYNLTSYLFSTGTGESAGLNNRVGGRCRGRKVSSGYVYNMTLRLRVCPEGTAGTPECPICMTAACFNYGCGKYSEWNKTNLFQRENNKCYAVYRRTCDYMGGDCEGPSEKMVPTDMTNCIEPNKIAGYEFTTYMKYNNSCYAKFKKICSPQNYTGSGNLTNVTNVTNCNATKYVKVAACKCKDRNPVFADRSVEESGIVSMVTSVFTITVLAAAITGLVFGVCIGFVATKKKFRPRSIEECQLKTPRKDRLC